MGQAPDYTDVRSTVLINGHYFCAFRPFISALVFLSIEVLAANIRCNPAVSGLRLLGISSPVHVLYLYGDDTSVFSCANCATKVLFAVSHHGFEKGTGAKLNSGECERVWLSAWRGRLDKPVPIQWFTDKVKRLGV